MRILKLAAPLAVSGFALFVAGCSDHVDRLDEARQAKVGNPNQVASGGQIPVATGGVSVPPLPGGGGTGTQVPGGPTGGPTCAPRAPQQAPAWRPPTQPRKACTQQEGQAVVQCMLGGQGCNTPVSQGCQACAITTKGTASYYGPIIFDPQTQAVEINVEGCAALLTGDISQAGCGGRLQAIFSCEDQACGHCQSQQERDACMAAADKGPCAQQMQAATQCVQFAQKCMSQSEAATAFNLIGMFCGG